ncbi:hypothetical protein AgCh_033492 [Apium graveolens]
MDPNREADRLETHMGSSLALVAVVLCLIGSAFADEAPAPSPMSAAGTLSPSFAVVGCAVVALLFGSALKM